MSQRFFHPTSLSAMQGGSAALPPEEAQHLIQVMRAKVGQQITLFDGQGCTATAIVTELGRNTARVALEEVQAWPRSPQRLCLAVAFPKGERQRWLVEKLVELGVDQVIPLETRRSVAEATPGAISRWQRWSIEAAKQAGQNWLPEFAAPKAWTTLIEEPGSPDSTRLLADFSGQSADHSLWSHWAQSPKTLVAVGPEGGWEPAEVAAAREQSWQVVRLGGLALRVETAAVVLATLLRQLRRY